jgi:hypothetical protein
MTTFAFTTSLFSVSQMREGPRQGEIDRRAQDQSRRRDSVRTPEYGTTISPQDVSLLYIRTTIALGMIIAPAKLR